MFHGNFSTPINESRQILYRKFHSLFWWSLFFAIFKFWSIFRTCFAFFKFWKIIQFDSFKTIILNFRPCSFWIFTHFYTIFSLFFAFRGYFVFYIRNRIRRFTFVGFNSLSSIYVIVNFVLINFWILQFLAFFRVLRLCSYYFFLKRRELNPFQVRKRLYLICIV